MGVFDAKLNVVNKSFKKNVLKKQQNSSQLKSVQTFIWA